MGDYNYYRRARRIIIAAYLMIYEDYPNFEMWADRKRKGSDIITICIRNRCHPDGVAFINRSFSALEINEFILPRQGKIDFLYRSIKKELDHNPPSKGGKR